MRGLVTSWGRGVTRLQEEGGSLLELGPQLKLEDLLLPLCDSWPPVLLLLKLRWL